MRFVPVSQLKEGMMLGKALLGPNGQPLLYDGNILNNTYIERIRDLGYSGIYVKDDISKEIEVEDIIDEKIRNKTIKSVKEMFVSIDRTKPPSSQYEKNIKELIDKIVDEIFYSKDVMVNIIDLKLFDDYTFYHSVNVCVLSLVMGTALEMNKDQLHNLALAALFHDIGKMFVPKEILNKKGKLSETEFEIMKRHPTEGYKFLKEKMYMPVTTYMGVLQHHEKFNGTGYPSNINGDTISLYARIIGIADVYDALTSRRPYRDALPPSEAMEYIMGGGGLFFDPKLVTLFSKKVAPYPVGTYVTLSNNAIGIVVENYQDYCLRPKVKIVKFGDLNINSYYIDLKNDPTTRDVTITGLA